VVFEMQPMIATNAELLRATLHALLVAQGFKLLARVVFAVSKRRVQVVMLPAGAGPIAPPRSRDTQEATIYTVDPRWLEQLTPDDAFLCQWCDALVARQHGDATTPGTAPVAHQLEPVQA
jgi:hypothetical protein